MLGIIALESASIPLEPSIPLSRNVIVASMSWSFAPVFASGCSLCAFEVSLRSPLPSARPLPARFSVLASDSGGPESRSETEYIGRWQWQSIEARA